LKLSKTSIAVIIVILFHVVGLVGFYIAALQPLFLKLVPFHLLLMLLVILYSHQKFNVKFISFALLIAVTGFIAEWIGVHKRIVFGDYIYGSTLGLKLDGIPLTMGVNWFLLIYCAGVLLQYIKVNSVIIKVAIGALVLTLLDTIIEPVAVRFDYWHWLSVNQPLTAPVKNYIAWFIVSVLMLLVFQAFRFKKQSIVGIVLLATQFVFFMLLGRV
jgi:putative membrane protein